MRLIRLVMFWLALGVTLPLSQAQNTTTLRGSIHDESGQAVANATVSVQQEATRLSRSASTGADVICQSRGCTTPEITETPAIRMVLLLPTEELGGHSLRLLHSSTTRREDSEYQVAGV